MKNSKVIIGCVAFLIILLVCICSLFGLILYLSRSSGDQFILIKESGKVYYKTNGDYRELTEDEISLDSPSFVKTENGNSHVLLPDNSLMTLDSNTEIEIKFTDNSTDVHQIIGRTWHRVQTLSNSKEYNVNAPNLIAGVRGTIFGVDATSDIEQIFVIEEAVNVRSDPNNSSDVTVDKRALFGNDTFSILNFPEDFELSVWFIKNRKLDEEWKKFDSNSSKNDIIDMLKDLVADQIDEVPYEVSTILSPSDISELEANDFKVNKGFNPVNIEGTFRIDNWSVKYDKMGIVQNGFQIDTCDYTFSNQTDDGQLDVTYKCTQDIGSGTEAFISGNNSCVSIYINQFGSYRGCDYNMPAIISACLDSNGFTDFQYANLMKSKSDAASCQTDLMPVGNLRIITNDDASVEKVK